MLVLAVYLCLELVRWPWEYTGDSRPTASHLCSNILLVVSSSSKDWYAVMWQAWLLQSAISSFPNVIVFWMKLAALWGYANFLKLLMICRGYDTIAHNGPDRSVSLTRLIEIKSQNTFYAILMKSFTKSTEYWKLKICIFWTKEFWLLTWLTDWSIFLKDMHS